jgi:hypothetical protein
MLDTPSLELRMACERLKDEAAATERQCAFILGRFDHLDREPTAAERDGRRNDYLQNRARLSALIAEIDAISRHLGALH